MQGGQSPVHPFSYTGLAASDIRLPVSDFRISGWSLVVGKRSYLAV
jgi:hypothetical protein